MVTSAPSAKEVAAPAAEGNAAEAAGKAAAPAAAKSTGKTAAGEPAPAAARRGKQGTVTRPQRREEGYFAGIARAAWSILEGMAVTFSYFRRPPITVQYPDRTPEPVSETLPERFRGLLEADVLLCTGCQACERACPINAISIRVVKEGKLRFIERFDIDLGKCMYCGFCVEACPVDAQVPGEDEPTHGLRFTREFEGVVPDLDMLVYRFIEPGDRVLVAKNKKGQVHPTAPRGEPLREARLRAAARNPGLIAQARARRARTPFAAQKAELLEAMRRPCDAGAAAAAGKTAGRSGAGSKEKE